MRISGFSALKGRFCRDASCSAIVICRGHVPRMLLRTRRQHCCLGRTRDHEMLPAACRQMVKDCFPKPQHSVPDDTVAVLYLMSNSRDVPDPCFNLSRMLHSGSKSCQSLENQKQTWRTNMARRPCGQRTCLQVSRNLQEAKQRRSCSGRMTALVVFVAGSKRLEPSQSRTQESRKAITMDTLDNPVRQC